jgi:predicted dehydrogenase
MEAASKRRAGDSNGTEGHPTQAEAPSAPKRKRAILVGAGSMGRIYLDLQQETGVEFVQVVKSTAALEQALENEPAEAVVIASPGQFHVEQVLLAARYGKRILCEKPLGLSAQDAKTIQDAGVTVYGFQRRYDNHFKTAHSQLDTVSRRHEIVFHVCLYFLTWSSGRLGSCS